MATSKTKWSSFFLFKGSWPYLVVIGICLMASSTLGALTPLKIAELAKVYSDKDAFYAVMKTLAFLFGGVYINRALYQFGINKYVCLLMQNARSDCYEKWLHTFDIQTGKKSNSERYPQGEVISRIMNDTESLRELMTSGTFGIFIDLFFVVACLFSFVSLNKTAGLFLSSVEVMAALALVWGSKYMRDIFLKVRKSRADMSRTISNVVGGVKDSYYTNHGHYASKKGALVFDDFLTKILHANIWDAGYYSVAESLYPILLALVVFIFPYSKITEAAMIFAIVDLIQRSINPIKDVSAKIANIQRAWSGVFRINEFLDDLDTGYSSLGHKYMGHVELDHMDVKVDYFEYPKRKGSEEGSHFHLKDIYFQANKGELVGVVGLSGCGKSTLLNILAANIIPKEGELRVINTAGESMSFPGKEISDIIHYREQVGIVSQESHVFSASVAFNITLKREKSDEFCQFWEWVSQQIPYIKQWGIKPDDIIDPKAISLGQRQLLAAIRSCFLKKPIVLFDEISSALDSELELALREMVLLIQKNSLTFIVAHRLETILEADNILVMDNGRVIDSGKHKELLETCEKYQEFLAELSH